MSGDADLLPQLLRQLTQKETPPPADDNALIQKMIAPNDSVQMDDTLLTTSTLTPAKFKWGGLINGQPANTGGWKWNQGQWK